MKMLRQLQAGFLTLLLMTGTTVLPAKAYYNPPPYYGYAGSYYGGGFLANHPYVKKSLIGGGIGALAGGLLASEGNRSGGAVKGALLGSAVGMGYEYLRERGTFSRYSRW